MLEIKCIAADYGNGTIQPGMDLSRIAEDVIEDRSLVVLKGVFAKENLLDLRTRVYEWGLSEPASPPESIRDGNWHRFLNDPPRMTPMKIHDFMFDEGQGDISSDLWPMVSALRDLQQSIVRSIPGSDPVQADNVSKSKTIPVASLMHYPCGGGYFDWHTHKFLPGKIGLFVCLSRRGDDFQAGGISFATDGKETSIEHVYEVGDILIFRLDLSHRVSPVDPELAEIKSEKGRWSFHVSGRPELGKT